jgi:bis(5'-nucleosyl)-tetraphosphatase (symmetrical)
VSTYAIGDIQGCFDQLIQLLNKVQFDEKHDYLWFAGDLVNRGPKSLETLRFIKKLGDRAIVVLGNHDLHLLAVSIDNKKHYNKGSLDDVLNAPDSAELLHWLRHRPLFHYDEMSGYAMVHAGLPPDWTIKQAGEYAKEVEQCLQSDRYIDYLKVLYGNKPSIWDETLCGFDRLRFITNCLTRLRYCDQYGHLKHKEKRAPELASDDLIPWYQMPGRLSADTTIIFGHWSTLGYRQTDNVISIDTGCLWGEQLTLLSLEDGQITQLDCSERARKP